MKKILMVLGFVGLTATLSACQTTEKDGLSSLTVECRTAGYCDETAVEGTKPVVKSNTTRVNRTERVFSNSLRK